MSLLDEVAIRTPENVTLGAPVAGIGSRFLAALLDTILILLMELACVFAALSLVPHTYGLSVFGPALIAIVVVAAIVPVAYYVVSEVTTGGRSPGKGICGLRVVRLDGVPVGPAESLVRNTLRLIDFLPMAYGVGFLSMFLTRPARRLGDLAAGTLVIHDPRRPRTPSRAAELGRVPVTATDGGTPIPHLDRCGPVELGLLRSVLTRTGLSARARAALAAQVAGSLWTRLGVPAGDPVRSEPPEAFLERCYLQLSARLSPGG
ncbi:MAG TPA: RDD family protein [Candidatus Dormibacteraeota bacterium]|nr:RDD family protein [Candidatus Dormibacteraeota bacterium]